MRRAGLVALALALLVVPAASSAGITFSYTITSGTAGDNGWYRSSVTVSISVVGATDTTCPVVKTFRSNTDPPLDCTATDGNGTIPFHLAFKIDTDAPTVTGASPSRAADANGWFNQPVSFSFTGSDATSGIASCSTATYSGSDSGSASVSGTCRDIAGNVSAPTPTQLKYDATPPSVTPAAGRSADANGWYNHAVDVTFAGSDATSGIDSCTGNVTYAGPDTAGASLAGSCVDHAGNRTAASLPLKYDGTPPSAAAKVARQPDERGWYTRPVAVAFTGTDALSGLADCTPAKTYNGPDNGSASVGGTCRDNAGNTATAAAPLKYDATAPKLQDVAVAPGGGEVTLTWKQPTDVTSVAVTRSPGRKGSKETVIYKGKAARARDTGLAPGVDYHYRLTSLDEAGNQSVAQVTAKLLALYSPAAGKPAHAGTALRWNADKSATYYNLQLYRGTRKVLSTWPVGTSFRLPKTWSYAGHRFNLTRGKYKWFVWPGRGPRAQAKYGALLGSSTFVVR
jgi:hypothetical protein